MGEDFDVDALLDAALTKDDKGSPDDRLDRHRNGGTGSINSDSRDRDRERRRDDDRGKRRGSRERRRSRSRSRDRRRSSRDRKVKRSRSRSRDRKRRSSRSPDRNRDRGTRDRRQKQEPAVVVQFKERSGFNPPGPKQMDRDRRRSRSRSRGRSGATSRTSGGPGRRTPSPVVAQPVEELTPEERDMRTVLCLQLAARVRPRDLEEFFSSVGKVRDVRLILHNKTRQFKGAAYVEFYEEEIMPLVKDVRLIMCNKTRRFKGICYVEFIDPDSVSLAIGLSGQKLLGIPIIVQPTQAEKNRQGTGSLPIIMPGLGRSQVGPMKLYVGSLHFNITEDMLRGIFEPFGKIDSIQLATEPETGRSKGYGFITFLHAEDAKRAMEQLNGFELAGRPMKVGHVSERPEGMYPSSSLDSDEMDRAGIDLGATGRLHLMAKLAQGTGLELPPAAATALSMSNMAATTPSAPMPSATQAVPPIATPCFMLSNMFTPGGDGNPNWDQDIRDDVIEECNKHGGVLHMYVDRASPQGNVYVKCTSIMAAAASVSALHGRWFGGRVITAAYVPLVNYHSLFDDAMANVTPLKMKRQY